MSAETVRLARETYDAWDRGDAETILAAVAGELDQTRSGSA